MGSRFWFWSVGRAVHGSRPTWTRCRHAGIRHYLCTATWPRCCGWDVIISWRNSAMAAFIHDSIAKAQPSPRFRIHTGASKLNRTFHLPSPSAATVSDKESSACLLSLEEEGRRKKEEGWVATGLCSHTPILSLGKLLRVPDHSNPSVSSPKSFVHKGLIKSDREVSFFCLFFLFPDAGLCWCFCIHCKGIFTSFFSSHRSCILNLFTAQCTCTVSNWVPIWLFGGGRYASVMALESTSKLDDEQWLAYWILYSFITLMELLIRPALEWWTHYSFVQLHI